MSDTAKPWLAHYPAGVPHTIDSVPFVTLAEAVRSVAGQYGEQPAFSICLPNGMGATLSFAEVDRLSDAFAAYLREVLGLKQGDRVAIQMPNCLDVPIAAFGVFKAGCVLVNVNPLYTAEEMGHQFKDAAPEALIIIDMFADKLEISQSMFKVKHIVLGSLTDFFAFFPKLLVSTVQKHIKKMIPPCPVPHTTFASALAQGKGRADKARLASYIAGMSGESIACLQYTGGTTGVSKGAMLTHANLAYNMAQTLGLMGDYKQEGKDIVLTALPLYHIFAFTINLVGYWMMGGHNVLIPSPRPLDNLKKAFEKFPITAMTGVNTLYNGLNNADWFKANPPKHMRLASAGGMALFKAVADRWEEIVGCPLVEGYGLTETSPVVSFNPPGHARPETIGIPVASTEVRLVDDEGNDVPLGQPGELVVRGPQVMKGYWQRPDETAKVIKNGWFHTGDVAVMSEDGYFKIVDRKKDMILTSGFNVFPNEVEDVLAKHPGIVEAAVIGIPDGANGEAVKAFVVKRDPALTEEDVRAFCKQHLTGYKVPRIVAFRDDLPKSNVGKILRKDLRGQ